jgi:hypothetical protein
MKAYLCMLGMLLLAKPAEAQFERQEVHPFQSADTPLRTFWQEKRAHPSRSQAIFALQRRAANSRRSCCCTAPAVLVPTTGRWANGRAS